MRVRDPLRMIMNNTRKKSKVAKKLVSDQFVAGANKGGSRDDKKLLSNIDLTLKN